MSLQKPLLVYDSDCGICRRAVRWMQRRTGGAVFYEPYQTAAERFPEVPRGEFERAVQLFGTDGTRASAAEAIFRALAPHSWFWRLQLWKYRHVPGVASLCEWAYRLVARHRSRGGCPPGRGGG